MMQVGMPGCQTYISSVKSALRKNNRKGKKQKGTKKKKRRGGLGNTYKSVAAAASSGLPPLRSGMNGYASAPPPPARVAPGTPNATFFPSISIVAPDSFAAVSLR